MIKTLTCMAFLLVLFRPAGATPITFQFSGHVTQVPLDEMFGDIAAGDLMHASLHFDTSASDLIPGDPATGSYSFSAPFGIDFTIDSHVFSASGSLNIGVVNSFVDQFTVLGTSAAGDLSLELFLQDNTGNAFSSDQLPLTMPTLADFLQRDFHLDATSALGEVQVDGQLDAANAVAIPEPRLLNFTLAILVIVMTAMRRKYFIN